MFYLKIKLLELFTCLQDKEPQIGGHVLTSRLNGATQTGNHVFQSLSHDASQIIRIITCSQSCGTKPFDQHWSTSPPISKLVVFTEGAAVHNWGIQIYFKISLRLQNGTGKLLMLLFIVSLQLFNLIPSIYSVVKK